MEEEGQLMKGAGMEVVMEVNTPELGKLGGRGG